MSLARLIVRCGFVAVIVLFAAHTLFGAEPLPREQWAHRK
jgi:hypothetical protein